jgi:hypothetical protein
MKLIFALVLVLLTQLLQAKEPVVQYFGAIHFTTGAFGGDFNGKDSIVGFDSVANLREVTAIPELDKFFGYIAEIGSQIDQHSVSLQMGYFPVLSQFTNPTGEIIYENLDYLRLGFEYKYMFFWPRSIRLHLGLGYGFTRLGMPANSFDNDYKGQGSLFSGMGPSSSLGCIVQFSKKVGLELGYKYEWLTFQKISTDQLGLSELNPGLKATGMHAYMGIRVGFGK